MKQIQYFDLQEYASMNFGKKNDDATSKYVRTKMDEALQDKLEPYVSVETRKVVLNADETETTAMETEMVADILAEHGIDITTTYSDWVKVGFAIADGLGESGRNVFHKVSSVYPRYDYAEADRQYTHCLNGHGSGVTIKSFFGMAKDVGIDIAEIRREALRTTNSGEKNANNANLASDTKTKNREKTMDFERFDETMPNAKVALSGINTSNVFTFSDKLEREDLDFLLRFVYDRHTNDWEQCDAMIIAVLNVVSGMMGGANGTPKMRSGIYGIYDKKRVFAPLNNIVFASAGSGKGELAFTRQLLAPIREEMRKSYQAQRAEYEKAHAEWEAKKKKERGEMPREPQRTDPFVPANSSSSAVYRALDANKGWGLMFETEADTVSNMLSTDYGNYTDLLRRTAHHEEVSMQRVNEKIHIVLEEPRLSVMLTCTPGQLPRLFPSSEDGTLSRFLFYSKPDKKPTFHNVFANCDEPLDEVYRKVGNQLMPLFRAMKQRAGHPIQFVMSQKQQEVFLDTQRFLLDEQISMLGNGISAFVFRMGLACFRYAMVLTTLRRMTDWIEHHGTSDDVPIFSDDENALPCDERAFRIAMTIVDCFIYHEARVYAVLKKQNENPFDMHKNAKLSLNEKTLYDALPYGQISKQEINQIGKRLGLPQRSLDRYIGKFSSKYCLLRPLSHGVYLKPDPAAGNSDN